MSVASLVCPRCGLPAPERINMPSIGVDRYTCWNCGLTTLREELVVERAYSKWGGGIRIPVSMQFIGSASSISSSDNAALSVANVSIGPGERLYAAYLSDFVGTINRVISITWAGQQVGQNPIIVDNVTRQASLDTDGQTVLFAVTYNPTTPASGTFTVTETGSVPDNRLLAVFRMLNAGAHLPGDEGETEDQFSSPVTLGPLTSTTSSAWVAAAATRSLDANSSWTGATRIRKVIAPSLTLDVALGYGSPFSAVYTFTPANMAGTLVGYP